MTKNGIISKELYSKIRKMSREEFIILINKARASGRNDALKETEAIGVNLDKIRSEIKALKGIGDARTEKVIEIIKNNLE